MQPPSSLTSKIEDYRNMEDTYLGLAARFREMRERAEAINREEARAALRRSSLCPCVPGAEPCEEPCEVGRANYDAVLLEALAELD